MKKFYAILCLAIASLTQLQAQAPQGFNYQATVRNSSGDLIVNTNVYFKFNVIQGSQTAVPIFTETHYVPTDDLGQVNLVIGQGTANTGVFSELDWSQGSYYLGIELDTGSGYVAMGTTQLLSVPYALYAESSGSSSSGFPSGGTEGQVLSIVSGVPTWTDLSGSTDSENLAEITTVEASEIDFESMTAGGNINDDGGFTIVSKGVVWSESPDPTPELETKTDEGGGASSFTSIITGLDEETEYFYRAYAITSAGTAYGSTYSFTTDSSQFYDQDGDGYTPEQGDCNDSDDSINPGATEVEDGVDNNCDGAVDYCPIQADFTGSYTLTFNGGGIDAAGNAPVWGDGTVVEIVQGSSNSERIFTVLCYPSFGFGQPETDYSFELVCGIASLNGEINNTATGVACSAAGGISLQSVSSTGTFDAQDDSTFTLIFNEDVGGVSCGAEGITSYTFTKNVDQNDVDNDGDGYAENQGDCDDNDAQINPGATEIEDGVDNDCDGQIDEGFGHSGISGTWRLAPEAGALGVGPELDNVSWWSNSSGDVTTRACLFDDTYVFNADGSFQNVVGADTWIEPWQGAASEGCGTPVVPHDGSATATYTYDEAAGTITLVGVGAYLGLARVINGGELTSPTDAPDSVTYLAALSEDGNTLELDIEIAGGGHWSFKLVKDVIPAAIIPPILESSFEDNRLPNGIGDGRDSWRNSDLGGVIQITSSPVYEGSQASKFPSAGDRIAYQELTVTPNSDYILSYFYTLKTNNPGSITVSVIAGGGHTDLTAALAATIEAFEGTDQSSSSTYVPVSISFNSGANDTVSILVTNQGEEARIDSFSIALGD